jgi:O-antigen/teichoic acid export membrane protein
MQVRRVGYDLHLRWDRGVFKELVKVGFPSHLNGLLYNIFLWVDRWLILSFLGLTSFGYYALGMTINEYLFQFSYALGNIISPHLVERYSEREKVEDLRKMVEVPMIIISRVAPAVLGAVYFASEAIVRTMLPKFEPGLVALQVLLVGTFFSSVPRGLSSFFITLRKQAQTVALYLFAIGMNAALVWWLISSGHGLAGAAAGTTTTLALFGFGLIVMALRYFMGVKEIALFVAGLIWPLLLGLGLVWVGHAVSEGVIGADASGPRLVAGPVAGAALFLAAYSPVLWFLYRSYGSHLATPDGGTA